MYKMLQYPLSILNWFIPKVNIHLSIGRKTYFKKNVFNTQFSKNALLSHLSNPFISKSDNRHTNQTEIILVAEAFKDLGYNVDVIDFDHNESISYDKYHVIFGFGNQFEASFYSYKFSGKRIMYSPGFNTVHSNLVSCIRLKDYHKNGGELNPRLVRTTDNAWPLQKYLSDSVICLGNEKVLNSYKKDYPLTQYYQINCFPLPSNQNINTTVKDYSAAKYNLLWFGSQGSVHKGLDIALALVEKNPLLKLFIRGLNTKHEYSILESYKHLIENNQVNLKPYVDINSTEYAELMQLCGSVIFPSASEGSAPALLTVMSHGGLIPISTKGCGLDIEHLGFIANETTLEDVELQLCKYLAKPDDELLELSQKIRTEINAIYNIPNYQKNIKTILEDILN